MQRVVTNYMLREKKQTRTGLGKPSSLKGFKMFFWFLDFFQKPVKKSMLQLMFLPTILFPEVGKWREVSRSNATKPDPAVPVLKGILVLVVAYRLIPGTLWKLHIITTDQEKIDQTCSQCCIIIFFKSWLLSRSRKKWKKESICLVTRLEEKTDLVKPQTTLKVKGHIL